jgi:hypothetical protein
MRHWDGDHWGAEVKATSQGSVRIDPMRSEDSRVQPTTEQRVLLAAEPPIPPLPPRVREGAKGCLEGGLVVLAIVVLWVGGGALTLWIALAVAFSGDSSVAPVLIVGFLFIVLGTVGIVTLVFVKRPRSRRATAHQGATPSGWFPDPSGAHRVRYWAGERWSEWVADDEPATTTDPLSDDQSFPPPTALGA